eukprot:gene10751-7479_t
MTQYEFSYEIKSKQIRRYKVNSLQSVRRAISSNIQDYLEFQGIREKQISLWSIVPNIIIIALAALICFQRFYLLSSDYFVYEIFSFYAILVLKYFWDRKFVVGDVIFEGTGNTDVKEHSKAFVRTLCTTQKKLRVLLLYTEKHNAMILKLQLVEDSIFSSSAKLLCSVDKRIMFCRYFNSQGFFYPSYDKTTRTVPFLTLTTYGVTTNFCHKLFLLYNSLATAWWIALSQNLPDFCALTFLEDVSVGCVGIVFTSLSQQISFVLCVAPYFFLIFVVHEKNNQQPQPCSHPQ